MARKDLLQLAETITAIRFDMDPYDIPYTEEESTEDLLFMLQVHPVEVLDELEWYAMELDPTVELTKKVLSAFSEVWAMVKAKTAADIACGRSFDSATQ